MNPFDPGYYKDEELKAFGFASVGEHVQVGKNCTLIGLENISLGNDVRIDGNVTIAAANGTVVIGSYVHIATGCFIGAGGGVVVEDFCGLSVGVRIFSSSDDYSGQWMTNPTVPSRLRSPLTKPVKLERHAIVGSGSVVLPGCVIGQGCAVGALSLVTKSLQPWSVYFGNPARKLRARGRALLALEEEALLLARTRDQQSS